MNYEILLFDVDNTLLDFDANEAVSFQKTMTDKGIEYSDELFETYQKLNENLWKAAELGKMTVNEVCNTRFATLMKLYDKEVDGVEFEQTYRSYLNLGLQEMPYVHEVLSKLQNDHKMYIITNGYVQTQTYRLTDSGLSKYFQSIFISEAVGSHKPMKEFFDYVQEHIEGFDVSKALVIGDSLTSDIKGGNLAGIDTCWYCKEGTENDGDIKPTYTIHSLKDLYHIV